MKEFIIRLLFMPIVFVLYYLGEKVTDLLCTPIELKYLLPFLGLVFWDYYFDAFSAHLLKLKVTRKSPLFDDNGVTGITATVKLSYSGKKDMHLRWKKVEANERISRFSLSCGAKTPGVPEEFTCILNRNDHSRRIMIKCEFEKHPLVRKIGNYYILPVKMQFEVNYDKKRTKRILLWEKEE